MAKITAKKTSKYKLIRSRSAGVFLAIVESCRGQKAVLRDARRIWYWSGAASLSQLAIDGTSKPDECKFPEPVSRVELFEVIEILDVTVKALASLQGVRPWKA